MVNFLQNITALAGAATLCKIFDYKNSLLAVSGGSGADNAAVVAAPTVAGALPVEWLIVPQANAGTFTLQSATHPSVFVSYAAATIKLPGHSQAVVSDALPSVFKAVTVGGGPAVNLIDINTNFALTSWAIADPAWTGIVTPITIEPLNNPASFMQSFNVALFFVSVADINGARTAITGRTSDGPQFRDRAGLKGLGDKASDRGRNDIKR
ncbi:hypothetical protein GGX14DRAFT_392479 [Mycena pura]|uniref:Uncharacterized protein n=1 Tax=Mycena pura TaxID=153505 RepID=A0AAD6YE32_9AGAR|nr:hypothetical protein GGX14DRAFT_392479 [Mycena pura]